MQQIWNIVIITSKDDLYKVEYDAMIDDINKLPSRSNMRFLLFEYDNKPENTKIFKYELSSPKTELTVTEDCRDIYMASHMINLFNRHVIQPEDDAIENHYVIITWGHGGGLCIFPRLGADAIPPPPGGNEGLMEMIGSPGELKNAMEEALLIKVKEHAYLAANLPINKTSIRFKEDMEFTHKLSPLVKRFRDSNQDLFVENIRESLNENVLNEPQMLSGLNVKEILEQSFGLRQIKIDILITINCFTQTFEFGLGIKDHISLLVSPQTMIPFAGINYRELFRFIEKFANNTEKPIDKKGISRNITGFFWNKYTDSDWETKFNKDYPDFPLRQTSLSCNDLSSYGEIEKIIGSVGVILLAILTKSDKARSVIDEAREKCDDLSPSNNYGIIDFTLFLKNVLMQLTFMPETEKSFIKEEIDELNKTYAEFLKIRSNTCLSILMSQAEYYIERDKDGIDDGTTLFSGSPFFLSIYYPKRGESSLVSAILSRITVIPPVGATTIKTGSSYEDWLRFIQ